MRWPRAATARATLLLVAAVVSTAPPVHADLGPGTERTSAGRAVREFWETVQQLADPNDPGDGAPRGPHPAPQAVATGGPTINLADLSNPAALEQQLRGPARLSGVSLRLTIPSGQARLGDFSIGSDQTVDGHLLVLRGNADVYGRLQGNLVTYDGDVVVHPGASISGDVLALHGQVRDQGGEIAGEVRTLSGSTQVQAAPVAIGTRIVGNLAGVAGVFLTLLALGFGLVLFGRSNLEIVSDTVTHSFGRSFITGLVGQILLLPTFGMLVVGLILSVAGILLLPFAVVVYALLVVVGVVGGALAVIHAMGETYTRRRLARGAFGSANSYRFLLVGMVGPAVLWLAWALFGWVPVAGNLIRGAAVLVTWLITTTGLGAALLSRAGIKENFAGRIIPPEALTDEYLWATPQFGVPAVRRPGGSRTPNAGR